MSEICIISGTNRVGSKTLKIAKIYQQLLKEKNVRGQIFSLEDLPRDFAFSETFGKRGTQFQKFLDEIIVPHQKFVFISPEYNGSFPGVLKTFLDAVHPKSWTDKKAALVGVSDGRAGNLRGMEHLTNILNHLKINVYHMKVPLSQVDKALDQDGHLINKEYADLLNRQIDGFLKF